jgi:UDP-2,3-diacylglucosamine hydrolase
MEITAAPHWQTVDFISDLHLQASAPQTLSALAHYLANTPAQALFILGDLFEVWVGDDALRSSTGIEHGVAQLLRQASARLDLFIMRGNRDFLMGAKLLEACGARALPDPSVLHLGSTRWLLVHGDAQCLADVPYQAFRAQVRSTRWQRDFLNQPLDQRQALARQMRAQSEAQKKQLAKAQTPWIDLDREACLELLDTQGADHMIHGHTHQAAQHDLGLGRMRWVLSDWDLDATPPRAEVLRLHAAGGTPTRLTLAAALA